MKQAMKYGAAAAALMMLLSGCESGAGAWFGAKSPSPHGAHQASEGGAAAVMAGERGGAAEEPAPAPAPVQVKLIDAKGAQVGMATLTQQKEGVRVQVEASALAPGKHGLHFHETGKCVAPDFKSAGAHFNPDQKQHGFDNPKGFHNGDLPNLEAGADGKGTADYIAQRVTLEKGKPNSLLKDGGTALVIHEKADDYKTDPSGNSGDRIACGVVQ